MTSSTPKASGASCESVEILRDEYGVPHIFADDRFSLFYGYGYALAEDRLFQMEMTWRCAIGRVAEASGPAYVAHDKACRSNYDPISLHAQFEALESDDRAVFEGYAAGYNARVDEVRATPELLPHEFDVYDLVPSHITVDAILGIFVHDMAIRFSGWTSELDNLQLLHQLRKLHSEDDAINIFRTLLWEVDKDAPTTIAAGEAKPVVSPTFEVVSHLRAALAGSPDRAPLSESAFADVREQRGRTFGELNRDERPKHSLGWVTGKHRTIGALATLVDGAQMGFTSPSIVWNVGLHGAGFNVVGTTQVGVPAICFGTNGTVAWGGSAGVGDLVDTYQEQLNPANPHEYMFKGAYHAMERRTETIKVRGASDESIEVLSTVHGLVRVHDAANGVAFSERRAWQGRELETLMSWLHAGRAQNYPEWQACMRGFGLSINMLYADSAGKIAYDYTGRYPKRPATQDFRIPASGTGDMEWEGFYDFSDNPQVEDPADDCLSTWNNLSQPGYHSSDSWFWSSLNPVAAIQEQLAAKPGQTAKDVWDVVEGVSFTDANAPVLKPLLERALAGSSDARCDAALALIAAWNGTSPEAGFQGAAQTMFTHWLTVAQRQLFDGVLPSLYLAPDGRDGKPFEGYLVPSAANPTKHAPAAYPSQGTGVLAHALGDSGVAQHFDLLRGADRDDFIRETFRVALDQLAVEQGDDMAQWRTATPPHEFITKNFVGVPITTPDRTVTMPRAMNRGTFNFLVNFAPEGTELWDVVAPGQSAFRPVGGAVAATGCDQVELYEAFDCKRNWLTEAEVRANAKSAKALEVRR